MAARPRRRGSALAGLAGALAAALALTIPSCTSAPPASTDDLCAIFAEREDWHRAARSSFERWGVPEPLQLAFVHQESRFRAREQIPDKAHIPAEHGGIFEPGRDLVSYLQLDSLGDGPPASRERSQACALVRPY